MEIPEVPNGYVAVPRGGIVPAGPFVYHHPSSTGVWSRSVAQEKFVVGYPYGEGTAIVAIPRTDAEREW